MNANAKKYRLNNNELIKKQKKEHWNKNKEKLNEDKKKLLKTFNGFFKKLISGCKFIDTTKKFEKICVDINFINELTNKQNNL